MAIHLFKQKVFFFLSVPIFVLFQSASTHSTVTLYHRSTNSVNGNNTISDAVHKSSQTCQLTSLNYLPTAFYVLLILFNRVVSHYNISEKWFWLHIKCRALRTQSKLLTLVYIMSGYHPQFKRSNHNHQVEWTHFLLWEAISSTLFVQNLIPCLLPHGGGS